MLSQTSEYALRATLFVAMHDRDGPVKLEQVARALGSPRNYLSKTLHLLARAGVLRSERGPHGGFSLAKPAESMSLAEVVAQFDPARLTRHCILGEGECSDATACAAHALWKPVAERMRSFLTNTTVADLISGEGMLGSGAGSLAVGGEEES